MADIALVIKIPEKFHKNLLENYSFSSEEIPIVSLAVAVGTVLEGRVIEAKLCYERKTYIKPVVHDYSDKRHPNYFKYSCPVCDSLGNLHQVMKYEKNCPLCNVNLYWVESEVEE